MGARRVPNLDAVMEGNAVRGGGGGGGARGMLGRLVFFFPEKWELWILGAVS